MVTSAFFFSLHQDVCLQVIDRTSRIRHWRRELFAGFPPSALAESDQGERRNIQMEMQDPVIQAE